jgi:hypothetical protein
VPRLRTGGESIEEVKVLALIELVPTLEHCIETTAKREFARVSGEYLQRGGRDRKLEERAELLRLFLESADFRELRSESERHLVEGRKVTFVLHRGEGELRWEMEVQQPPRPGV